MILLDSISIQYSVLLLCTIAIIAIVGYLLGSISTLKQQSNKNTLTIVQKDNLLAQRDGVLREKDLIISNIKIETKGKAQDMAKLQFEQWRQTEWETYQKKADQAGLEFGKIMLQRWKIEEEGRIRKDATNRSVRVVLGKATENLVPFTEAFQYNPRDTRFIGSPIDLIVFDGMEEKTDIITIYFIEVKTGTSALSQKQRKIKDAIEAHRVKWDLISLKDFGDSVNDELKDNF